MQLQELTINDNIVRIGQTVEVGPRTTKLAPGHELEGYHGELLEIIQEEDRVILKIYANGWRAVLPTDLVFAKAKKRAAATKKQKSSGPVDIKCQGYQPFDDDEFHLCEAIRTVGPADAHHVKRCKSCQAAHNRAAARFRAQKKKEAALRPRCERGLDECLCASCAVLVD